MSAVIEHTTQARLVIAPHQARPVVAHLQYDPSDPLAMRIAFPADASLDGAEVSWVFARELLRAGLNSPVGEGDVRLRPCAPGCTVLQFHATEGIAVVEFDTAELSRFLSRSYTLLPTDQEERCLRLDHGLAALLGSV